ncbi:glycosyltransferase [Terrimonas sp.]|uniref:glycosyltransferase n=1 Tax=Terrimonas sp. TaxID=1914338 RepID=UPI001F0CDBF8|nr:glycosyltransferase [Terrimonas sp.]
MKTIYFAVISDLSFDQRMQRICRSLAQNGYKVVLVGKRIQRSVPLQPQPYEQRRLFCWFTTGKIYYAEFNIKLFFFLLFKKMDAICTVDLDTIVPCYFISKLKKAKRIYDAHELFTEMKEVMTRPPIQKFWLGIERKFVPKFPVAYTVSQTVADEFKKRYGIRFNIIRNVPYLTEAPLAVNVPQQKIIIYQGAVNKARGFESLIPAMQTIEAHLYIYGDGNFMPQLKLLIREYGVEQKVFLMGMKTPEALKAVTANAYAGINLVENIGLNQYYSLANKFFDYMQAGIPQITMCFPEYKNINDQYEVAVLIDDLTAKTIADAYTKLCDGNFYSRLRKNCLAAGKIYNWQNEEKKLIDIYNKL